jgi:hypothetical protein
VKAPRLAAAAAVLALGLAACTPRPPDFSYAGSYDPLYAALSSAERNLSSLSEYQGKPAGAAMAMAQFLFIQTELQDEDAAISLPPAAGGLVPAADREVRSALGLAAGTPPRAASSALRRFARTWAAGDQQAALQALNRPYFTLGPQGTLAVLQALPRMPALENLSYQLTRAAGNMQPG